MMSVMLVLIVLIVTTTSALLVQRMYRRASKEHVAVVAPMREPPVDTAALEHEVFDPEFLETLKILGNGQIRDHDSCTVCHPARRVAGSGLYRPLLHQPKSVRVPAAVEHLCYNHGHAYTHSGECVWCGVIRPESGWVPVTRDNHWIPGDTCASLDALIYGDDPLVYDDEM